MWGPRVTWVGGWKQWLCLKDLCGLSAAPDAFIGALDWEGCPQCRMSGLRNDNVACYCR